MNGVKPVILVGRCRSRICADGRFCRTCPDEIGGPVAENAIFGTAIDIDAKRLARRS
jgi:hypothetical protein